MYCRTAAVSIAVLLACCSRQANLPGTQRLAILRFENLGSDASTDWMGRAFSEVITRELTGSPGIQAIATNRLQAVNQSLGPRPVSTPGISSQRTAALAAGANRLGYGNYSVQNGRLDVQLTIEDPASGKMLQTLSTTAAPADVIAAATTLARQVSGNASAYLTANSRTVEHYARALESTDAATATGHLEASISADPNFAPAYQMLAELKVRQQDRAGATQVFENALTRGAAIGTVERAQIEGELATLRGDSAQREQAAATLAKSNPLDPAAWRTLAETAFARRNYPQSVEAFAKTVELEPNDVAAWNQYGYAAAYAGDMNTAMTALQRYQSLRPAEANPLDSQGDVHLLNGRLKEAEDFYLHAAKKDPNFVNGAELFKAAMARLMTGDIPGADGIARHYVEARKAANDPLAPYRAAEWDWVAGRRKQAYRQMESLARAAAAGPSKELAVRGYTQLAVWSLMLGERDAAASMASQALPLATPASALAPFVARFLAQSQATPAVWSERAERAFQKVPVGFIKELTLAFALLFGKEFAAASPVLTRLESRGTTSAETDLRILLAWTLTETGNIAGAAPLLRWNPIPPATGASMYMGFHFPRIYYLRAVAAEKEGRTEDAKSNYRLFLQLSGSDPLMWGEEKKAKAALQ